MRVAIFFLALAPLAPLRAQQTVAERLSGRVSPEVAALVNEAAAAAAARGLPIDPLIQKAVEGGAKHVLAYRVADAVRTVVMQLDTAAAALRAAEYDRPDTTAIAAGGFAVAAGLRGRDIADIARVARRGAADLVIALRVAGTLAALGVPPTETVALVNATLRAGEPPAGLLSLPSSVQSGVSRGMTPAQAAAGLARSAAAQDRRGPPPRPDRPPPAPPRP